MRWSWSFAMLVALSELSWGEPARCPSVAILAPADGATVSGVVEIQARVLGSDGIVEVVLLVDYRVAGHLKKSDQKGHYALTGDSAGVSNGSYRLTVLAYDRHGCAISRWITVQVENLGGSKNHHPEGPHPPSPTTSK